MESTWYVFPFRMVFFYLVTTGWIFDISLYVRIQSNQSIVIVRTRSGGRLRVGYGDRGNGKGSSRCKEGTVLRHRT